MSDFFVAAPEQITEEHFQEGPAGRYPTAQWSKITPVEMEELLLVVRNGKADDVERHDEFPLILTCPGEESWVIGCPSDLQDALAGASEQDLARYAAGWAAAEQLMFTNTDAVTLLSLLTEVASLARLARTRNESLYLWICL